jgi:dihydrofolate reductase
MRRIRIIEHISLDGVIQAPGGRDEDGDYAHGGWTAPYRTAAGREAVAEAQGRSFDLLLGRRTYDIFAGYWPKAENSPIADGLNAATKYVATHRPESLGWGPVGDLGRDIMEGVRGVKSMDGPDLVVWGSSTLTPGLLEQGLVDEVVLLVYPVLLGRGKRFFSESADPRELALVSTKATSSGVLINTYRPVGSLRTEPVADASGRAGAQAN